MKLKIKPVLTAVLTASVLLTSPLANAEGIPTVDLKAVQSWIKQADQMTQQINHLREQIQHQVDTINAIRNIRDLDGVVRAIGTLESMPDEWADIYQNIKDLDPTGELKKLTYDPEMALKNAMSDLKVVDTLQKQFDPNNPTGFRKRLEQATDLLKSADSQVAVQKATALILAEQTRMQQAQFEYATMKAKYEADEKANAEKRREVLKEQKIFETIWSEF